MVTAVIIDYRIGNIFSMNQALTKTGFKTSITADPRRIEESDAVILPGVGNFSVAAHNLASLSTFILETVKMGVPLLGSCLGMQLLFEWSEEGEGDGLGLMKGGIVRFPGNLKIPHMGWNTIKVVKDCEVLEGLDGEYLYFVHSYYARPDDLEVTATLTDYGLEFASMIAEGNVYGAQFHPEKSGPAGLMLLENFFGLVKR
jgi:glutamine amidotransferase